MAEANEQFKKSPRRKGDRGKTVTLSAEARQAYADLMTERTRRNEDYAKHLPATPGKR